MQKLLRKGLSGLALLAMVVIYILNQQADGSEQGDYYLLALSWTPSWCDAEGDARGAPQCDDGTGWQVHGLWPQHAAGGWPEYCDTDARDPSRSQTRAMADIMGDDGLAWHQWKKHGRCSGLSADAYFAQTRAAFEGLDWPETLTRITRTTRLSPDAVEAAFRDANPQFSADMVITTCRDGDLRELRLCLTEDLRPRSCGTDVLERACRARQISLPPPD
ncbi:MAG: ribonuclease T2 [Roseibaca calidilacus]|uniref:Ribonuclease T2 n=1 Tax=Roseibaca calidilacus TaxID=1666912 RepID=A0A0P7WKI9_9RHOB|nr:ribonuclease T2 [Roseibaca calidilacus]KPP94573.1 MAG: ribonuclease T2 [Roseibaca calidilacus]CUX83253.1 ribonuclease T2 [Roseibaca calidilacus]